MRFESVRGIRLPKVGFGTWRIGGGLSANHSEDSRALTAFRSALELGYSLFDTAEIYGAGHTEELLGRAIKESGAQREAIFIASKVKPEHLRFESLLKSCEGSLRRLGTDYLDLYLIHWPNVGVPLTESFRALNKLVADGKIRHLGVSNFDLKLLKASQKLSEMPILTDQVPYSISDRSYEQNGVLAYCQSNEILLTAYTPLDNGHMKPDKTLRAIAEAHSATTNQIALAWLVAQRCVITIPMSQEPDHQRQNLEAADIELTRAEIAQLA